MASYVRVISFNDAINYTVHYQNLSLMNRHHHHYVYHIIMFDHNFHEEMQHLFVAGISHDCLRTTCIYYSRCMDQEHDRVRKCCSGAIVRIWLYPETLYPLFAGDEELLTKRAGECILPGACPAQCTCNGATVDCSNKRLTAIPKDLPLYTSTL